MNWRKDEVLKFIKYSQGKGDTKPPPRKSFVLWQHFNQIH